MRKALLILALVLYTSACQVPMPQVYNGCLGSFITVTESTSRDNVLVVDLPYGQSALLDVDRNRTVTLLAQGFDESGRPLGSATWTTYVSTNSSSSITGPREPPVWEITHLRSSDSQGGCRR